MKLFKSTKEKLDKKFIRESYRHYLDFNDLDKHKISVIKKHLSKTEYNKLVNKEFINWVQSIETFDKNVLKSASKAMEMLDLNKNNLSLNAYKNLIENVDIQSKKLKAKLNIEGIDCYYKFPEVKQYLLKGNWISMTDVADIYFSKDYILIKSLGDNKISKLQMSNVVKLQTDQNKIYVELKHTRGMILVYKNPRAIEIAITKIKTEA